jgi:hypothetical protein
VTPHFTTFNGRHFCRSDCRTVSTGVNHECDSLLFGAARSTNPDRVAWPHEMSLVTCTRHDVRRRPARVDVAHLSSSSSSSMTRTPTSTRHARRRVSPTTEHSRHVAIDDGTFNETDRRLTRSRRRSSYESCDSTIRRRRTSGSAQVLIHW